MSDDGPGRGSSKVRTHGSAALYDGGFAYVAEAPAESVLFTAGISPLDVDGAIVAADDPVEQTSHAVGLLTTLLGERGADPADVVKLTVYVVARDRDTVAAVWQAMEAAWDGPTPPAVIVGTTVLPYPGQVVELDAVAVR